MVGIAAGLWVMALLSGAGLLGYAIARSGRNGIPMAAAGAALVLMVGTGAAVAGAIGYARVTTVAGLTPIDHRSGAVVTPAGPTPGQAADLQPQTVTDAWLHFDSDSGDYIGAGNQKVWTLVESNFTVVGSERDIRANVSGQGDMWNIEFRAPSNGTLRPGVFLNAERAPFVTGKAPGLEISGDGRGCNTLSGRFDIKEVVWNQDGEVSELDVLFEQHCEGGVAALRGELWVTTRPAAHRAPPLPESTVSF